MHGKVRRSRKRNSPRSCGLSGWQQEDRSDLLLFWTIKALIPLGGYRELVDSDGFIKDDDIMRFVGLGDLLDRNRDPSLQEEVVGWLKETFSELPEQPGTDEYTTLEKNMAKVEALLQLDRVESKLLRFAIHLHYHDILDSVTRTLNDLTTSKLEQVLAVLLDETKERIRSAIAPGSRLIRAGVIAIERQSSYSMRSKIEMPFRTFVDMMMTTDAPVEEMLKEVVRKCGAPKLGLKDFGHLQSDLDLLVTYLDAAMNERRSGVNVLLYGPPGTGKTELTKSLAHALGCGLFEISYADEDDEAITGAMRLRAYKMAQSFFKQERLLFMFDEIEDVFADEGGGFPFSKKPPKNKAWMNRVLESNETPTVWITNDVSAIDEAVIRRFDLSLEIPVPPLGKREEIVRAYSGDLLDEGTIRRLSRHERVSPAIVSSATRVTKLMRKSGLDVSGTFERIVSNTLKAQGYSTVDMLKAASPDGFRPEYVNTQMDLGLLAEEIKANPNARICLYGVPGTGKSAFGRWLSEVTNRPFHLKKGSDLLSMWLGGTEQNIASAFEQAKRDGAVLVFDEVDSFLQERREAQRSWEVTQVNEMLVQMESFEGIFIATTNLVDGLDRASLRRFDLKLEFGPLSAEQAWGMLCDEAQALGLKAPGKKARRMLGELSSLCAGDYAAVRRQSRFHSIKDVDDFIDRLAAECAVKEVAAGSRMGFLA